MASRVAMAQVGAPTRNWSTITKYVSSLEHQDSIFTFFGGNSPILSAKHSTGDTSTFVWKRYNSDRKEFEQFFSEDNRTLSRALNLEEGGYRVEVTSHSDSTETYTAWVFVDDVVINSISDDNNCNFLELIPKTTPNVWDIAYERFAYWDLSKPMHTVNNTYGKAYFNSVTWESSESQVEVPSPASFKLVIESPAPLYSSQYAITVKNPFGRILTAQTTILPAIAVKAAQAIKIFENNSWANFNEGDGYEALLEMSLESEAINADSASWRMSKLDYTSYNYGYVEFWRDSVAFGDTQVYPDKSMMTPGRYRVKNYAKNSTSGCVDSVVVEVLVDSAMIKKDAIPNVFSPTIKDGTNDVFVFISPEDNIRSMKSCAIRIYNRSGNLVHKYDGNPKKWEGWDGNVMDSNRMAPQGVYFYIIECVGWDGRKFRRGPYKGTLYLF